MNEELKHLFTPGPMVFFRSSTNIGGIITDLTLINMCMAYHACKNTCTNIFVIVNIVVFLMMSQ